MARKQKITFFGMVRAIPLKDIKIVNEITHDIHTNLSLMYYEWLGPGGPWGKFLLKIFMLIKRPKGVYIPLYGWVRYGPDAGLFGIEMRFFEK